MLARILHLKESVKFSENRRVLFLAFFCDVGGGKNVVSFLPKAVQQRIDLPQLIIFGESQSDTELLKPLLPFRLIVWLLDVKWFGRP